MNKSTTPPCPSWGKDAEGRKGAANIMNKSTKPPCPSWGKGWGKGLQYISAMALLLFGSAVVTFSLVVDPSGAIDYSVNTFFGEAAATALVIFGLRPPNSPTPAAA